MNADDVLLAISQREQLLRDHERPGRGMFPRDFMATYGISLLHEIEDFDRSGIVRVSMRHLTGKPSATAAVRMRLSRALKKLATDGLIERPDNQTAKLTAAGREAAEAIESE